MSLFRRGEIWWVDIASPTGKRLRKSTGTNQAKLAQEYHDQLKADLWKQSKLKERPTRTWRDAADRWLASRENKPNATNNARYIEWLTKHLDGLPLSSIDKDLIDSLAEKKAKEKRSGHRWKNRPNSSVTAQTVNHYMGCLRSVLRSAWEWGWIESAPPVAMGKIPKKRIRFLTRPEARKLLEHLVPHMRAIVGFALATGLRQRNILSLEWTQIDLEKRFLWIHADQAKAGKDIRIPLNQEAIEILRSQEGKHPERVFTYKGKPVETIGAAFESGLKKAGIENFRFHDLRHTWASWHVQGGTPLAVLQELGGWASLSMVMRYSHLAQSHLSEWAERSNVTITTQSEEGDISK